MVARTVQKYICAGLAACHIEDQVQTKRCGHLMGKQVVSREEFVTRIRAAVIARDAIPGSDFVRHASSPPLKPVPDRGCTGDHWPHRLRTGVGHGRGDLPP